MRPGTERNMLTPRRRAIAQRFLKLPSTRRTFAVFRDLVDAGQPSARMLNEHMMGLPTFMQPHRRVLRSVATRAVWAKSPVNLMDLRIVWRWPRSPERVVPKQVVRLENAPQQPGLRISRKQLLLLAAPPGTKRAAARFASVLADMRDEAPKASTQSFIPIGDRSRSLAARPLVP
jgi:hypothetical protein